VSLNTSTTSSRAVWTVFAAILLVASVTALVLSQSAVQAEGIVTDNAEWVSTDNVESSAGLITVAGQVSPRIVVEYSDPVSQAALSPSQELKQTASFVTSRIVVEYSESVSQPGLYQPEGLSAVATAVPARIVVEYAESLTSEDLSPIPLLPEPTDTLVNPSSFTLESGKPETMTATLLDFSGNPISGKAIYWTAPQGIFSPSSGATDSAGQVSATYSAPQVVTDNSTTITASFAGDSSYRVSLGTSLASLTQLPVATSITISPPTFSAEGGKTAPMTATLKAGDSPLSNGRITWQSNYGSIKASSDNTSSSGQVAATYYAPKVTQQIGVTITASFAAESPYETCSASVSGSVTPGASPSPSPGDSGGSSTSGVLAVMGVFIVASVLIEYSLVRRRQ
jgi:hypothetical protein